MAPAEEELLANQLSTVTSGTRATTTMADRYEPAANWYWKGRGFSSTMVGGCCKNWLFCVGKEEETASNVGRAKRTNGERSERGRNRSRESRPRQILAGHREMFSGNFGPAASAAYLAGKHTSWAGDRPLSPDLAAFWLVSAACTQPFTGDCAAGASLVCRVTGTEYSQGRNPQGTYSVSG